MSEQDKLLDIIEEKIRNSTASSEAILIELKKILIDSNKKRSQPKV